MSRKLFSEAITKFIFGVVLVGALVFLPAGTFFFLNGYEEYKKKVKYRLIPFVW